MVVLSSIFVVIFLFSNNFLQTALSVSFEFKKEETYVQDRFFDRVTLLYDGSTVVLHWTVTDANLSYAYLVLDDVVVDRKVVAGVKVRLELRVTGSTKIGKYKCRVGNETSEDGFELAYKLCPDNGETCRSNSCPKTEYQYYCMAVLGDTTEQSCARQNLEKELCDKIHPQNTKNVCVKKEITKGWSLCDASRLKESERPLYMHQYDCTKSEDIKIMDESFYKDYPLGAVILVSRRSLFLLSIGPLKELNLIQNLKCTEKVFLESYQELIQNTFQPSFNHGRFGSSSYISKLICSANATKSSYIVMSYVFLVNIEPQIFLHEPTSCQKGIRNVTCSFLYPMYSDSFTSTVELLSNSTPVASKNGNTVNFEIREPGNYSCKGTINYRTCTPFTEYNDSEISNFYLVEEACTTTSSTTRVIPGLKMIYLAFCFLLLFL